MPYPTQGDSHVNVPLTDMAIRYQLNQKYLVADNVFPNLPVMRRADRYYVYQKGDWARVDAQARAPATESVGGGWSLDNTPTYYCEKYAIHKDIDDDIRANADEMIAANFDKDATQYVTQQLLRKREQAFVQAFFTKTSGWDTTLDGTTDHDFVPFDDVTVDPVITVKNQMLNVLKLTGYMPNIMVVGPEVHQVLENHSKILDRIKYTQRGIVTEDILAAVFGVEKYLVPRVSVNTAAKGQTDSMSLVYGKNVLLAFANPSPSIEQPSAGYTFSWKGYFGASGAGLRIKQFRIEPREVDRIEGEMAFDMKMTASDLGCFMGEAVA